VKERDSSAEEERDRDSGYASSTSYPYYKHALSHSPVTTSRPIGMVPRSGEWRGAAAGSSFGSGISLSDADWAGKVELPRSSIRGGMDEEEEEEEEETEDQETVDGSDDWEREGMAMHMEM